MPGFLLIHGGWHGGWVWETVSGRLSALGHDVAAPTLPGVGANARSDAGRIGLEDYISAACATLDAMTHERVVLCGHSLGGFVITGIADRMPGRVAALVYLDAFLPGDGDSAARLMGLDTAVLDEVIPPPPAAAFQLRDPAHVWLTDRLMTPQPTAVAVEPIRLSGRFESVRPRFYVLCSGFPMLNANAPFSRFATYDRLALDPSWQVRTLACGHNAMQDNPAAVTEILLEAARLSKA